jgi:ABC-type branched-subunit amino acid transport system permease subunit
MVRRAFGLVGFLAVAAIVALAPHWVSDFRAFQLASVGVYVIAIVGLNVLTGYSGQISLGHGAFMAIGGYTTAILMAKHGTAGVYGNDPRLDPDAEFLPELTHREAIERGLKVMDTTALSLCMDNNLPIYVFALADGNIRRVIAGERIGTIISTPAKEER